MDWRKIGTWILCLTVVGGLVYFGVKVYKKLVAKAKAEASGKSE